MAINNLKHNHEGYCEVCGAYSILVEGYDCMFCFRWAAYYDSPMYDYYYIDEWGYIPEFHPKVVNQHLKRRR